MAIEHLSEELPIFGSAILPKIADALGIADVPRESQVDAILGYLNVWPFPSDEWQVAYEVCRNAHPDLLEEVITISEELTVCDRLSSLSYRHAWTLSDQNKHNWAVYAATVLWQWCTHRTAGTQQKLGQDHILTCFGLAVQEAEYRELRADYQEQIRRKEKPSLYRLVYSHSSYYSHAQFWSPTRPEASILTSEDTRETYEDSFGIPAGKVGIPTVVSATLNSDYPWVIRDSVQVGTRKGGRPEFVTAWGATTITPDAACRDFLYRTFHAS